MKKRFTEAQIIGFLREADAGMAVKERCRRHGARGCRPAIKRMSCGCRDSGYFFLKIKAAFPGNP